MKVTWVGSPNHTKGRAGNSVQKIVIHWMVGTLASTDAVFQNTTRGTSAHYGIEDSNVHQYVQESDTAYHAGDWSTNLKSIGIEHSAAPGRLASDATYSTTIELCTRICKQYGINPDTSIIPHNSIVSTQCPGTMDLNRIKIGVKLKLNGGEMEPVNKGDVQNYYWSLLGRDPDPGAYGYVGQKHKDVIYAIINSPEYKNRIKDFENWKAAGQALTKERDEVTYPFIGAVSNALNIANDGKVAPAIEAIDKLKKNTGGGISAEDSAAIKETNSIVKGIRDFLASIFKSK